MFSARLRAVRMTLAGLPSTTSVSCQGMHILEELVSLERQGYEGAAKICFFTKVTPLS